MKKISIDPKITALLWRLILPPIRRRHTEVLLKVQNFKNKISRLTPGIDATTLFLTHYFEMKEYLQIYKDGFELLQADFERINDETFDGFRRAGDIDTIITRVERICNPGKGSLCFSIPISKSHMVTADVVCVGGMWGLPKKTIHNWNLLKRDQKQGVRGTQFFDSMNAYQIIDYHLGVMIKDELKMMLPVLERMTSYLPS
jgi:hypothetical protein